jgi:hypothetical protein
MYSKCEQGNYPNNYKTPVHATELMQINWHIARQLYIGFLRAMVLYP